MKKKRGVVDLQKYYVNGKFQACALSEDIVFDEQGENKGIFVIKDNYDIIYWNGKYYEIDDAKGSHMKTIAQEILGNTAKNGLCDEVVGCLRRFEDIQIERNELDKDINLINLRNGTYNLKTGEFSKHDKKNFLTYCMDIDYDPNADCPKIKKFMSEIHYLEDVLGMQEWFGYCLYKKNIISKFIIGLGEGANGKTVEFKLLEKFLGNNNTTHYSISELNEKPHTICELYGKLANINPEIKDRDSYSMAIVKALVSGESMMSDKKFKNPFKFTSYAKLIFACNKLPRIHEDTYAIWRRCIPINYPNKFEGINDDKHILEKISTDEEMSGLFNWSINGLKRLLTNGDFSFKIKDVDEIREYYKTKTEPIYVFTQKFLYYEISSKLTMNEVFEKYSEFVDAEKLEKVSQNKFGRELKQYFPMIEKRSIKINNRMVKFYVGLAWKNDTESLLPQPKTLDSYSEQIIDEDSDEQRKLRDEYESNRDGD